MFTQTRYKDYVSGGLHLKNLRDPDGGVHLARKKVLMGIADEVNPAITDHFPKDGYHDDLSGFTLCKFWHRVEVHDRIFQRKKAAIDSQAAR